jgi:transcriptional regulator with XRE-family HTH domain
MPRTATSDVAARVVGQSIRRTRRQAGLTQADVAARLNVNPSYVANLEAGRVNATLGQLAHVAEALGAGFEVSFPLLETERIRLAQPARATTRA